MARASLALAAAIAALAQFGCGDGHSYPAGFAAEAAKGEESFKSSKSGAGAERSTVAPPRAPSLGAAGDQPAVAASAPEAPAASASEGDAAASAPSAQAVADAAPADSAPLKTDLVVTELKLPAPPAIEVVAGEEPYKQLALDPKFKPFRAKAARYVQLRQQLLPLGKKLADGTATPAEREQHFRLEEAIAEQFRPLNRYMWDDRWTTLDRAAMGWILHGGATPKR